MLIFNSGVVQQWYQSRAFIQLHDSHYLEIPFSIYYSELCFTHCFRSIILSLSDLSPANLCLFLCIILLLHLFSCNLFSISEIPCLLVKMTTFHHWSYGLHASCPVLSKIQASKTLSFSFFSSISDLQILETVASKPIFSTTKISRSCTTAMACIAKYHRPLNMLEESQRKCCKVTSSWDVLPS